MTIETVNAYGTDPTTMMMGPAGNEDGAMMMDETSPNPTRMMTPGMDDDFDPVDEMMDDDMFQAFMDNGGENMMDEATESALNKAIGNGTSAGAIRQVSDSTAHSGSAASPSPLPATAAAMAMPPIDATKDATATVAVGTAPLEEAASPTTITPVPVMTGRPSIPLYLSCNPDYLSPYQCLIRKHVELFEASERDVQSRIKGRNKPIVLGQVGIRCRHCAHVYPVESRERGSMYYPHTLVGIYQAAQILSQQHLLETCPYVPPEVRQELCTLKNQKSYATAGKEYWGATAQVLGVYEDQYGLRFEERLGLVRHLHPH